MNRRWNLPEGTVEAVRPSSPFHCGVRMKTRVLIVDDEPIGRRGIRRYLAKHNDIEVVGEAANGISAVEQINELHPDIVFLDVQMPDLDGFGVIENVEPSTGPAPVYIFVTAHDAHAIRAFEVHAVDYLLKPYDKERFARALAHALQGLEQRGKANRDLEPLLRSLRSLRPLERFVVKDKKRIFFVPVSHVLWIEATGNYACIHTASDSHLLRETLTRLEEKLAAHHFIRVRTLTLPALARFVRCSMGFTTSYWQKERWSRRAADTLTSYARCCWNPNPGNWDV